MTPDVGRGSPATANHSPDGLWWWDGTSWLPAVSVDGRHWWSGGAWIATGPGRRFPRLPRWLTLPWCAWLPFLVAWVPVLMVTLSHHDSRRVTATVAVAFGGLAVGATIAFGSFLGYRRQWGYLAWSLLLGVAAVGVCLFTAFALSVPATAPDDPGLGLGALFVTAVLAPVVAAFLWLGGAVGMLVRRATT